VHGGALFCILLVRPGRLCAGGLVFCTGGGLILCTGGGLVLCTGGGPVLSFALEVLPLVLPGRLLLVW